MAAARSPRRLAHSREQVLETTLAMVAEQGLAAVTMAKIAARLDTSGGHLLYYFGTRDGLLLETLRWSEQHYAPQRAAVLTGAITGPDPGPEAALELARVYLPTGPGDARWLLWLEMWARAPYDDDLARAIADLDDVWHRDLVALLGAVLPQHPDPAALSRQLRAMWDGFAVQILLGTADVDAVVARTRPLLTAG
ncbi:TetR/AcrR family transcriptional regulator [Nocardioides sp.]|uniref:TetR/AcrR family transcriptional regulator n=1 Tax=Nocardioides sp. TaxID=35761 RepID=UPI0035170420